MLRESKLCGSRARVNNNARHSKLPASTARNHPTARPAKTPSDGELGPPGGAKVVLNRVASLRA